MTLFYASKTLKLRPQFNTKMHNGELINVFWASKKDQLYALPMGPRGTPWNFKILREIV